MLTREDKKSIFVCWMTESGHKNGHVDDFITYLDNQGLLKTENLPEFFELKKDIIDKDRKACDDMETKKKEFTPDLCAVIMDALMTAPDSQLAPYLKKEVVKFDATKPSLVECWDFIIKMSQNPNGADMSSFIRDLCWLEPFYKKPE